MLIEPRLRPGGLRAEGEGDDRPHMGRGVGPAADAGVWSALGGRGVVCS